MKCAVHLPVAEKHHHWGIVHFSSCVLSAHPSSKLITGLIIIIFHDYEAEKSLADGKLISHHQVRDPVKGCLEAGEQGASSVIHPSSLCSRWMFLFKKKGTMDLTRQRLNCPFFTIFVPCRPIAIECCSSTREGFICFTHFPVSNASLFWVDLYRYTEK